MRIISKYMVMACTVLLGCVLNAGVLYWQVDATAGDLPTGSSTGDYTLARLIAYESNDNASPSILAANVKVSDLFGDGSLSTGLQTHDLGATDSSIWSFYIELGNYASGSNTDVAWTLRSEKLSYSDAISKGYISAGSVSVPKVWSGGKFSAVPEPTSGLLLMMGGALLALRRRRRI